MKKKNIGRRITEIRRRAGISTNDLAEKVGKSQATISRIENGKQNLTLNLLIAISKALSVHPFQLIGRDFAHKPEVENTGCLGDTLKSARIYHNYSVRTISRRLNRPDSYIAAIENGVIMPEKNELKRFSELYNLNLPLLEELFQLEKKSPHLSKHFAELTTRLSDCIYPGSTLNEDLETDTLYASSPLREQPRLRHISPEITTREINRILLKIISNEP